MTISGGGQGAAYAAHGSLSDVLSSKNTASNAPTSTEGYADYGVNGFVLANDDPLSTFSIDVDTASYTITRRKLIEGQLPPTSAVRVEEFVNYMPYTYVGPRGDAPFAVNMEAAPHPFMPNRHIVRIGVQGRAAEDVPRKPARLTFLVDVSGSMRSADKLALAQRSLRFLVEQLGPEDTVAIATYAGRTEAVLAPTPATNKSVILDAIAGLQSGGSTAMASGMDLAYGMAEQSFVPGAVNRVIVLSDGDANVGRATPEQILEAITGYAKKGITLSTIGFGMGNYQDVMMEQLADKGDGNYAYIDDFDEAKRVFGRDLAGTLQVIARDVKIQVEWSPESVMSYRLVGYENRDVADRDFRNDKVDAGEIGAGHAVTAVYEVVLKDDALARARRPIATVRLRAKPPGADAASEEWVTDLPARLVRDELASASRDTRVAVGAAAFAELLRGSPHALEQSYADVWSLVHDAARPGVPEDQELLDLIARAGRLSGEEGPWAVLAAR